MRTTRRDLDFLDLLCRYLLYWSLVVGLAKSIKLLLQNLQLGQGRVSRRRQNTTPKMLRKEMVELMGHSRSHRGKPSSWYREAGRRIESRARGSLGLKRGTEKGRLSDTSRL